MKQSAFAGSLIVALAMFAGHAHAQVVLDNITGTWFDAAPNSSISSNTGGGTDNPRIRWSASGYNFDAASALSVTVPPAPSDSFALGVFEHVNQPVSVSIGGVSLRIEADVTVDSVSVGRQTFEFRFAHEETGNSGACPYGGANGQGVNVNGCADRVSVTFSDLSDSFLVGTDEYTLNIIGFFSDDSAVSSFLTAEGQTNTAELIANISLRSDVVGAIPEPSTYALMFGGLAMLGAAARRRRR